MSPEKINTAENKPAVMLAAQLCELVPEKYDPDTRHSVTRYIDGQLSDKITVTRADGRYNVITDIGKDHGLYWVTDDALILPMGQSDLRGVLEIQIPNDKSPNDVARSLIDLIERSSSERPQGRIAKALARVGLGR